MNNFISSLNLIHHMSNFKSDFDSFVYNFQFYFGCVNENMIINFCELEQ